MSTLATANSAVRMRMLKRLSPSKEIAAARNQYCNGAFMNVSYTRCSS